MKDFRTMKRQRGRSRSKSGGNNTQNPNRAYESNGPEGVKCRGNAQTIYEKYQQLARDANSAGDRVLAEGFLQHAEHYFRLIRLMQPQRPVAEFVQRDPFSSGYDDFEEDFTSDSNESQDGDEDANDNRGTDNRNQDNRGNDRDNRQDRYSNNNRNRDRDRDRDNRDRDNRDRDQSRDYQPRENREPRDNREPRENREPRDSRDYRDRDQNRDNRDRDVRDAGPREGQDGNSQGQDRDSNRRETRRERFERRRQQQQRVLDGDTSVTSFEPQTEAPIAPAFIASTQPLAPAKPVEQPVATDADALPDFIRRPTPIEPAAVAEVAKVETPKPEANESEAVAVAKPARKPRAKKVVAETADLDTGS